MYESERLISSSFSSSLPDLWKSVVARLTIVSPSIELRRDEAGVNAAISSLVM